jgi:hypothetical protein
MPEVPKVSLPKQFVTDLAAQVNRHGLEKFTNEPDYVTAEFLTATLEAYIAARQAAIKHKGG